MTDAIKHYKSTGNAPYFVTWTRQGETIKVFESWLPDDCVAYAENHITQSGITERIECHDYTGPFLAIYDKSWAKA